MSDIIRFPGGTPTIRASTSRNPAARLAVGPIDFTCTNCGATASADFKGMVFRQLDCYCLSCGSFYRITNPAFAPPTHRKQP